ncbi:MAG TPA: shikimate kinase [Chitinispirillaceae bacterium]|nr:shikimate kinase [Chitinispirillaceae bacterium]
MKISNTNNIVLTGMPGAGKSTAGVILAKKLCREFIDTDVLIQTIEKVTLQEIVNTHGYMTLRTIEERTIMGVRYSNHVIATGGSAVYSAPAMMHLKSNGIVVFLEITCDEILRRISDFATRGLACRPDQTLEDLFQERAQLYRKYADITIFSDGKSQEDVVSEIVAALQ